MAPATMSLLAFLMLTLWRLVFSGLRTTRLAREIVAPPERRARPFRLRLHIFDQVGRRGAGEPPENGFADTDTIGPSNRAQKYLRRVATLTGATHVDDHYVLNVGKTRFEIRDRWVRRLRDVTDPDCPYDETCFYTARKDMPKAEQIATALLHLKNNPSLFEVWAAKNNVAVKANGRIFSRSTPW